MIKTLLLSIFLSGLSCSLLGPSDYHLRINNGCVFDLINIRIGGTEYGTIKSGEITEYKSIPEGTHSIEGSTSSGSEIYGSYTFSLPGTHYWTVIFNQSGEWNVHEDEN